MIILCFRFERWAENSRGDELNLIDLVQFIKGIPRCWREWSDECVDRVKSVQKIYREKVTYDPNYNSEVEITYHIGKFERKW